MIHHRFTSIVINHRFGLIALLLALFAQPAIPAQPAPQQIREVSIRESQKSLDEAEHELGNPNIADTQLAALRDRLMAIREQAQAAKSAAIPATQALLDDLKALGPPPKQDAPPEAATVTTRRKELSARLAEAEGSNKEADLIIARTDRLTAQVIALRRARFTERILTRSTSPLSPAMWRKVWPEMSADAVAWYQEVRDGLASDVTAEQAPILSVRVLLSLVAAAVLAFPLRSWLIRKFGYVSLHGAPTYFQRLRAALFTGFVRSLLPSAAALAIYLTLLYGRFLSEPDMDTAYTALLALVFLFLVSGCCRAALAPFDPEWRLVPISDYGARHISRTVTGLALLFALDAVLSDIASHSAASVELLTVQKSVFGLLISLALLTLLRGRIWHRSDGTSGHGPWRHLRRLLALLVAAIPLSAMLGYVVLSRLLATQLVQAVGLYAAVSLSRTLSAELIDHVLCETTPLGTRVRHFLGLSEDGAEMLKFWLTGLAGFLILLLGLLGLLVIWGAAGKDLANWTYTAFFGFHLGNITFSLAEVMIALVLFAGFLVLTRILQKALDQRIFPRTRLDSGLRHSIRSAVGYFGFALGVMLAVSALGIDLSNLAIIAGALSVGIGLGLQNVVNNFVSGLILLVERPIKAGDWVVVGDYQGYVRKISVRATEIATFDRASVFIPNSSLISGSVMNRTYADKIGRVVLPVGVSYDSDPKKVRDILMQIALGHEEVRRNPAPRVLFRRFGDCALDFELFAYVYDVDNVLSITSDLCFEILDAFRREGVQIPYPQRDLHVNLDADLLRRILGEPGAGPGKGQSVSSAAAP